MPDGVYGRWGLRIRPALSGLIFQAGPQIAPGYQGRLFGLLFNLSSKDYVLRHKDQLWSIDFTALPGSHPVPARPSPKEQQKLKITDYATWQCPEGSLAQELSLLRKDRKELLTSHLEQMQQMLEDSQKMNRSLLGTRNLYIFGFVLIVVCAFAPMIVSRALYNKDEFVSLVEGRNGLLKAQNERTMKSVAELQDENVKQSAAITNLTYEITVLRSLLTTFVKEHDGTNLANETSVRTNRPAIK
jgi:hypothetical protein